MWYKKHQIDWDSDELVVILIFLSDSWNSWRSQWYSWLHFECKTTDSDRYSHIKVKNKFNENYFNTKVFSHLFHLNYLFSILLVKKSEMLYHFFRGFNRQNKN